MHSSDSQKQTDANTGSRSRSSVLPPTEATALAPGRNRRQTFLGLLVGLLILSLMLDSILSGLGQISLVADGDDHVGSSSSSSSSPASPTMSHNNNHNIHMNQKDANIIDDDSDDDEQQQQQHQYSSHHARRIQREGSSPSLSPPPHLDEKKQQPHSGRGADATLTDNNNNNGEDDDNEETQRHKKTGSVEKHRYSVEESTELFPLLPPMHEELAEDYKMSTTFRLIPATQVDVTTSAEMANIDSRSGVIVDSVKRNTASAERVGTLFNVSFQECRRQCLRLGQFGCTFFSRSVSFFDETEDKKPMTTTMMMMKSCVGEANASKCDLDQVCNGYAPRRLRRRTDDEDDDDDGDDTSKITSSSSLKNELTESTRSMFHRTKETCILYRGFPSLVPANIKQQQQKRRRGRKLSSWEVWLPESVGSNTRISPSSSVKEETTKPSTLPFSSSSSSSSTTSSRSRRRVLPSSSRLSSSSLVAIGVQVLNPLGVDAALGALQTWLKDEPNVALFLDRRELHVAPVVGAMEVMMMMMMMSDTPAPRPGGGKEKENEEKTRRRKHRLEVNENFDTCVKTSTLLELFETLVDQKDANHFAKDVAVSNVDVRGVVQRFLKHHSHYQHQQQKPNSNRSSDDTTRQSDEHNHHHDETTDAEDKTVKNDDNGEDKNKKDDDAKFQDDLWFAFQSWRKELLLSIAAPVKKAMNVTTAENSRSSSSSTEQQQTQQQQQKDDHHDALVVAALESDGDIKLGRSSGGGWQVLDTWHNPPSNVMKYQKLSSDFGPDSTLRKNWFPVLHPLEFTGSSAQVLGRKQWSLSSSSLSGRPRGSRNNNSGTSPENEEDKEKARKDETAGEQDGCFRQYFTGAHHTFDISRPHRNPFSKTTGFTFFRFLQPPIHRLLQLGTPGAWKTIRATFELSQFFPTVSWYLITDEHSFGFMHNLRYMLMLASASLTHRMVRGSHYGFYGVTGDAQESKAHMLHHIQSAGGALIPHSALHKHHRGHRRQHYFAKCFSTCRTVFGDTRLACCMHSFDVRERHVRGFWPLRLERALPRRTFSLPLTAAGINSMMDMRYEEFLVERSSGRRAAATRRFVEKQLFGNKKKKSIDQKQPRSADGGGAVSVRDIAEEDDIAEFEHHFCSKLKKKHAQQQEKGQHTNVASFDDLMLSDDVFYDVAFFNQSVCRGLR